MTLQAVDADVSLNGEPFTFNLVGGKDASKFRVDKTTGNIYSTETFDRETTPEFNIVVETSDNGKSPLRSRQDVKIKVADTNDSPSQPRNAQILIFTKQAISRMEKIASIRPLDQDLVGQYSCRLESGNEFFTVSKQCDLLVQKIPTTKLNTIAVVANDGKHSDVSSTFQSEYTFIDDSTIKNSVVVRIPGIEPSAFLDKFYLGFVSMLKSIFNSNPLAYSLISFENGTNIVLAVSSGNQQFTPVSEISNILNSRKAEFESFLSSQVIINFSPCVAGTFCQNEGTCAHFLKLHSDQVSTDSPHLILSSPNVRLELSCQCPSAFVGANCQYRKEPCAPNPCLGKFCIHYIFWVYDISLLKRTFCCYYYRRWSLHETRT
jgi:protocadherin Fat 4